MARKPSKLVALVQKRIRQIREERGLTQAQVCEQAGISIDSVTRIETGRREPNLRTIEAIADALGVSPAVFFNGVLPTLPKKRVALGRMEALLHAQPERMFTLAEGVVTGLVRASKRKVREERKRR